MTFRFTRQHWCWHKLSKEMLLPFYKWFCWEKLKQLGPTWQTDQLFAVGSPSDRGSRVRTVFSNTNSCRLPAAMSPCFNVIWVGEYTLPIVGANNQPTITIRLPELISFLLSTQHITPLLWNLSDWECERLSNHPFLSEEQYEKMSVGMIRQPRGRELRTDPDS